MLLNRVRLFCLNKTSAPYFAVFLDSGKECVCKQTGPEINTWPPAEHFTSSSSACLAIQECPTFGERKLQYIPNLYSTGLAIQMALKLQSNTNINQRSNKPLVQILYEILNQFNLKKASYFKCYKKLF